MEKEHLLSYPVQTPSPKGKRTYVTYIEHRLAMMTDGMAVYATRKYARLSFDKFVESYRASDEIAAGLTNKKPSMIYLGAGQIAPNSPIGIKRRLRCPGTRKLLASFKKLGNCVVRFVDEWMTSQHCAKCFQQFDRRTRNDRFKVCNDCHRIEIEGMPEPNAIVSQLGKRQLKKLREEKKAELDAARRAARQANINLPEVNEPIVRRTFRYRPNRPAKERLVSKIVVFFKKMLNDAGEWEPIPDESKTVWHRDTVAAKCILYKGIMKVE